MIAFAISFFILKNDNKKISNNAEIMNNDTVHNNDILNNTIKKNNEDLLNSLTNSLGGSLWQWL